MTTKAKKDARIEALEKLRLWHEKQGIVDFPKRFGLSTNEKKFREISFRVPDNGKLETAKAEDFIVGSQPIFGLNDKVVGHIITYSIWMPSDDGRKPGTLTIRFSLFPAIIGLVKIGKYFVAVEQDNLPIQKKTIGTPRMFGVTDSTNLDEIATILLDKEFPFLKEHIQSLEVTQLGNLVYQDPTTRDERDLFMLIEVVLKEKKDTKDDLMKIIDHRNKEMVLHHLFDENELRDILKTQMGSRTTGNLTVKEENRFRDQFSSWILASYFLSN